MMAITTNSSIKVKAGVCNRRCDNSRVRPGRVSRAGQQTPGDCESSSRGRRELFGALINPGADETYLFLSIRVSLAFWRHGFVLH